MKKLNSNQQKWLKAFHVFFVTVWVGGAIANTLMSLFLEANDGILLYGINLSIKFVDDFLVIPGAVGTFFSGILFSLYTKWGWFKHRWIIVKWIIAIFGVIFGTFFLGPWINSLPPISKIEGLQAFSNVNYMHNQTMLYIWGTFQALTLVFAVFVSVLKPWKKKTK